MDQQIKYFFVGFILAVVMVLFFMWMVRPPGKVLVGEWFVGDKGPFSLDELRMREDPDDSIFVYRSAFDGQSFDKLVLFLPQILDFQVILNDQPIDPHAFEVGVPVNIALISFQTPLDHSILRRTNTIQIIFHGDPPPLRGFADPALMTEIEYNRYEDIHWFSNHDISKMAAGALLLLGPLLLMLGKGLGNPKNRAYTLIGMGLIMGAIGLYIGVMDFQRGIVLPQSGTFRIAMVYITFSMGLILFNKGIGLLFFLPRKFKSRFWWLVPFMALLLWLDPIIPKENMYFIMNVGFVMLLGLATVYAIKAGSILTIGLSLMAGMVAYSTVLGNFISLRWPLIPYLRDHGFIVMAVFMGFLVIKDYFFLMRMENQARKNLSETYEELERAYQTQEENLSKLHHLIDLSSSMVGATSEDTQAFLVDTLEMVKELIPQADYQYALFKESGKWKVASRSLKPILSTSGFDAYTIQRFDRVYMLREGEHIGGSDDTENLTNIIPIQLPTSKEICLTGLYAKSEVLGAICIGIRKASHKQLPEETISVMAGLGNMVSSFFAFQQLSIVQESFQKEMVRSIVRILEIHDTFTKGHSEHVAELALQIAQEMDVPEQELKRLYWAGMVHDIGKILVPQAILNNPFELSDLEFEVIKLHPVWGYEVLRDSVELQPIANVVKYHHEWYDGNGYPDGISGDAIPILSRIIAVADAWDTMVRDRSYRKAFSEEDAIAEINDQRGKQFDPEVVNAFMRVMGIEP